MRKIFIKRSKFGAKTLEFAIDSCYYSGVDKSITEVVS